MRSDPRNVLSFAESLQRIDFYRNGIALLPDPGDKHPGVALFLEVGPSGPQRRFCDCDTSHGRTCSHILELSNIYRNLAKLPDNPVSYDAFKRSFWYQLGGLLVDMRSDGSIGFHERHTVLENPSLLRVSEKNGPELFTYFSSGPDRARLKDLCADFFWPSLEDVVPRRCDLIKRLQSHCMNPSEHALREKGFKTRGRAFDESIWYRLAYHCFREFTSQDTRFHPFVEEKTGSFMLLYRATDGENLCRLCIPRHHVRGALSLLRQAFPDREDLPVHPVPLKAIYNITINTELDLEVRPVIQMMQEDGETAFFDHPDFERFRYGNLVYIRELGVLAELEDPDRPRRFKAPVKMTLRDSQLPSFLDEISDELAENLHVVDEGVKNLRIFREFDTFQIRADAIERDWCWLSLKYGFGNDTLSLLDIWSAQKEGRRFISTSQGWVDCESPSLQGLGRFLPHGTQLGDSDSIRLSRAQLLRWQALAPDHFPLSADKKGDEGLLKRILSLKPSKPLPKLRGLTSSLRGYQERGLEWLAFLHENGLGGLLCDDMGLGKTHQVMALMVFLQKHRHEKRSFLVVCPTTVLSHWETKLNTHAPDLEVLVYHGNTREPVQALNGCKVLLTSYGIMRRDVETLREIDFGLAVFDEAQQIKNPETLSFQAAREIRAGLRVGLTGTPIENNLIELKALLDLVLPQYLGSDADFNRHYVIPIQEKKDDTRRHELSRVVSPFILRRLKKSVLMELPDKIEDVRLCSLSDDQIKLYRDAVSSRSRELLLALEEEQTPVPYMHIFALLNLLKQICDHPALVAGRPEEYERFGSGKWELFKELLHESLASGQKLVVYSQYLDMIRIIERYLTRSGIGHTTLTGQSRDRGAIISRFSEDPDCLVFVGSLRAGGLGIDLVAASVVVHYDRWWNAAREDQATDRVHRIGQNRGVHVFKLITEGTLEEKIDAIIGRKKKLADSILQEDDPGLVKAFTREELIGLLSFPDNP